MTQREKIGVTIIVAVFVAFGLILWYTVTPPAGGSNGSFEDNVIIDQRVRNLNQ